MNPPLTQPEADAILALIDYDKRLAKMTPKQLILEVLGSTAADFRVVVALMDRVMPDWQNKITDAETEAPCEPSPERTQSLVEQIARAIDGYAFHRYKDGDVLPRGHEFSTAEKENEIQGFRQRKAESQARRVIKALKKLGRTP